eukprot:gene4945-biopygen79
MPLYPRPHTAWAAAVPYLHASITGGQHRSALATHPQPHRLRSARAAAVSSRLSLAERFCLLDLPSLSECPSLPGPWCLRGDVLAVDLSWQSRWRCPPVRLAGLPPVHTAVAQFVRPTCRPFRCCVDAAGGHGPGPGRRACKLQPP